MPTNASATKDETASDAMKSGVRTGDVRRSVTSRTVLPSRMRYVTASPFFSRLSTFASVA
jgi:hypothetical protein